MKRIWIALSLLLLITIIAVYLTLRVLAVTNTLTDLLNKADIFGKANNLSAAMECIESYEEILSNNQLLLTMSVKRELIYELNTCSFALEEYLNPDTIIDFFFEVEHALERTRLVRESMIRII